ncbi:leucine-rich repeat-containing protein 28-like isoform X2 [Ostrea edulis]|uniref:leucine-rich repeat-containing protein 28-like isoform X2 n=1 Tax=Ostrea edulis TaxID=37623 RepID=UPI0024AFB05D|nr:leucine-rich repeat-containing protein 28-like isoform X2 [Ostrea edulis]
MADITSNQMNSILSMNYRGLEDMPTSLMSSHSAADVQHLYMKGNRLTGVPETIYKFENLTVLYLQSNRIESLPQTIGALKTLELLDVSFNYLEKLPEEIGCLQKLKRLYAFSNRLKQLPKSVGALQNLEVLGVMKNEISSLPAEIGRLVNLKELNVDSNHLTSLPNQLCCLGHLQELSASNNNLLTLPQDFGMMKTLVNIFVDNNPFLNSLPLSLKSRTNEVKIGLNRCGIKEPPEHPVRAHQHVKIRWKNYKTIIILPKQISQIMCLMSTDMLASPLQLSVWKRDPSRDCDEISVTLCHDAEFMSRVPSLLELTLRTFHHVLLIRDKSDHGVTLPQNIEELVHCPTAHCCQCNEVLFVSAFPFICQDNFSPQKPDAVFHFLGLCCTEQCFLQQLSGCL